MSLIEYLANMTLDDLKEKAPIILGAGVVILGTVVIGSDYIADKIYDSQRSNFVEIIKNHNTSLNEELQIKLKACDGAYSVNLPEDFKDLTINSCNIIANKQNETMISFTTEYTQERQGGVDKKSYANVNMDLSTENAKEIVSALKTVNETKEKDPSALVNPYKNIQTAYVKYYEAIAKAIENAKVVEFANISESSLLDTTIKPFIVTNSKCKVAGITPAIRYNNDTNFYVDVVIENAEGERKYGMQRLLIVLEGELTSEEAYESFIQGNYKEIVALNTENQKEIDSKFLVDDFQVYEK